MSKSTRKTKTTRQSPKKAKQNLNSTHGGCDNGVCEINSPPKSKIVVEHTSTALMIPPQQTHPTCGLKPETRLDYLASIYHNAKRQLTNPLESYMQCGLTPRTPTERLSSLVDTIKTGSRAMGSKLGSALENILTLQPSETFVSGVPESDLVGECAATWGSKLPSMLGDVLKSANPKVYIPLLALGGGTLLGKTIYDKYFDNSTEPIKDHIHPALAKAYNDEWDRRNRLSRASLAAAY